MVLWKMMIVHVPVGPSGELSSIFLIIPGIIQVIINSNPSWIVQEAENFRRRPWS